MKLEGGKEEITVLEDFEKIETSMIKLNLGCGIVKKEGYINVDYDLNVDPDICCDLAYHRWPWNKKSVDEINADHFLEHLESLTTFFKESYRILKPTGILKINCPYWTSIRCWQDPTHKRPITERTFDYFNQEWLKSASLKHYAHHIECNFGIRSIVYIYEPEWMDRAEEAREWARKHYLNVVTDFEVTLVPLPMEE